MDKNIVNASFVLKKKNEANEAYSNIANSTINEQRAQTLEKKTKEAKVATGNVNSSSVKSVIITDTSKQKVLFAIENLMAKYPGYSDGLKDIRTKGAVLISSNNDNVYNFNVIKDDEDITTTYVSSDPLKPDEQISVTSTEEKSHFDISSLYDDNNNVNVYTSRYRDIINNQQISNSNITSFSNEGIILRTAVGSNTNLPTYQLIPREQLEQDIVINADSNASISSYQFKDKNAGYTLLQEQSLSSTEKRVSNVLYKYVYCIDNVMLQQRDIKTCAGFVSKSVRVQQASYVELAVETTDNVEYSIIDGSDEIPILPQNLTKIEDEKLFFGMMPRFMIMNPDNIIVKRNNVLTGITTQRDLERFLLSDITNNQIGESFYNNDNIYTITYEPSEGARRYFPKTDSIKIKVIQRNLFNNVPKPIGNIKLLHYNVQGSWYLTSHELDNDYHPLDQRFKAVRVWNT